MIDILGINESLDWLKKQNAVSFGLQEIDMLRDYFSTHDINVRCIAAGEQYIFMCRCLKKGTVYIDITEEDLNVSLEIVKVRRPTIQPNQPLHDYLIRAFYPEKNSGGGALFGSIGNDWESKGYVCHGYDAFLKQLNKIMELTNNLQIGPKK